MFTIKLYKTYSDYTESKQKCISCPSYEVYKRDSKGLVNITIAVFPNFKDTEGVEFHLGEHDDYYDVCFIENEKGKTIERLCGVEK